MIIGNKNKFAVELEFSNRDKKMGYGKLWIQNEYFGTIEDLIYLDGYLIGVIEELLKAPKVNLAVNNKSELWKHLQFENKDNDDFNIFGSTFTDDFEGYRFEVDHRIFLVWRLITNEEHVFKELKSYGTDIRVCSVEKEEIKAVLKEVKDTIRQPTIN